MKLSTISFQGPLIVVTIPGLMAMPTSPADPSDTVGLQRLFNNGKFLACIADLEYTPECILAISYNADGTWQFRNSLASALVGEKCNQCQCL